MLHHHSSRAGVRNAAVLLVLALAACDGSDIVDPVDKDLEAVRQATAEFQSLDSAKAAGYTLLFMDMCMEDGSAAQLGGMGFHYVNTDLLDAEVAVTAPEAVLYETGQDGELDVVAVEYVIPKDAWTSENPPVLFGREFKLNAFDLWALHVWAWKDNPSGMFADWNPDVACQ